MIDRIVPATTEADHAALGRTLGLDDAAMVVTEPFRQWVIEDRFVAARPQWDAGGAQFTSDVEPFETAKLRMPNGTHSALAYLGLERGHTFVHEAVTDPRLRPIIEHVMQEGASSLSSPPPGLDGYARAIMTRLANAALPYRLEQIAADGSQKIPQRWLRTLAALGPGRTAPGIFAALAAWIRFTRTVTIAEDPMATRLTALWAGAGETDIAASLFGSSGLLSPHWSASEHEIRQLTREIGSCHAETQAR